MENRPYYLLALCATLLALVVIMLGAYTRLGDGGLGCPDWPGCYGQLTVPHNKLQVLRASRAFPKQTVEPAKAWKEMVHRYFAGTLGMLILLLAIWAGFRRWVSNQTTQAIVIPCLLIAAVIFQAALGMWTVTWKLLPLVVMGHLLGGMTIAALLWALTLSASGKLKPIPNQLARLRPWAIGGLIIVAFQIFLGGWTSANYASIICTSFPDCQGSLFPHMNIAQAFNFFSPIGANYEGGILHTVARITIQMFHRYGGFITGVYVGALTIYMVIAKRTRECRHFAWCILGLLALQITLGILNVVLLLPMFVAVAHNGVAALLLLSLVALVFKLSLRQKEAVAIDKRR